MAFDENKLRELVVDLPSYVGMREEDKDLRPLFRDKEAVGFIVDKIKKRYSDDRIDLIVSAEMQGFVIASMLAKELKVGMIPLRKLKRNRKGTIKESYMQSYGKEELEIHEDAIKQGERVLIVDDMIVSGQTAYASSQLVEKLGGDIVGFAFMIKDKKNKGIEKVNGHKTYSVINV